MLQIHVNQQNKRLRLLTKYLREKDMSVSLETVTPQELDSILCKFYAEASTEDGTLYKKSSLQMFRHGLCRYFTDHRKINIMKDNDFRESNRVYSAVCKDLKRLWWNRPSSSYRESRFSSNVSVF